MQLLLNTISIIITITVIIIIVILIILMIPPRASDLPRVRLELSASSRYFTRTFAV
jgi:hypothetical protein